MKELREALEQPEPGAWLGFFGAGAILLVGSTGATLPLLILLVGIGMWVLAFAAFGTWRMADVLGFGMMEQSLVGVAVMTLAFQVAFLIEHVAALGMWLRHPANPVFASPWASDSAGELARLAPNVAGFGTELLYLLGNFVFLAGLLVLGRLAKRTGGTGPYLRRALLVQRLQTAEQVLLIGTLAAFGSARGVSTMFGLVDSPIMLNGLRVWCGFGMNMFASWYAIGAVAEARRAGLIGLGALPKGLTTLDR